MGITEGTQQDPITEHIPSLGKHFTLEKRIGEGTFSSVYLAYSKNDSSGCKLAVKYITPISHPSRIFMELKCLKILGGSHNIIQALNCFRNFNHVALIMPYFPHDRFQDYAGQLTFCEVVDYMYNLIIALQKVHSYNIIHRDIKPTNFLYNRKYKRYSLVDFGLAEELKDSKRKSFLTEIYQQNSKSMASITDSKRKFSAITSPTTQARKKIKLGNVSPLKERNVKIEMTEHGNTSVLRPTQDNSLVLNKNLPETPKSRFSSGRNGYFSNRNSSINQMSCQCHGSTKVCTLCLNKPSQYAARAGTPGYRAPEVLMKYPNQTTAIDIWSVGVIFLSILSGRHPFFQPCDDITSLAEISVVLGTKPLKKAAKNLKKQFIVHEDLVPLDIMLLCEQLRDNQPKPDNLQESKMTCTKCKQTPICACLQVMATAPPKGGRGILNEIADQLAVKISLEKGLQYPPVLYKFVSRFIDPDPNTRISASEASKCNLFNSLKNKVL